MFIEVKNGNNEDERSMFKSEITKFNQNSNITILVDGDRYR